MGSSNLPPEYLQTIGEIVTSLSLLDRTIIFVISLCSTSHTINDTVSLIGTDNSDALYKKFEKIITANMAAYPEITKEGHNLADRFGKISIERNTYVHSHWSKDKDGTIFRSKFEKGRIKSASDLMDSGPIEIDTLNTFVNKISTAIDDLWNFYWKNQFMVGKSIQNIIDEDSSN